jgi:CelD/BcsL family acetyltransferase involved in cellulose biosynthesis
MCQFSILTNEKDIEALAPDWQELHRRCGTVPFTDYDWIMAWWRHVGTKMGARLRVCTCHEGGKLVGVIPLCLIRKGGGRILKLAAHEAYYYRTFLGETPEIITQMWRYILSCPGYDLAEIKNVHAETAEDAFFKGCAQQIEESIVYHCENLGSSREEILAHRSSSTQRRMRKVRKEILATPTLSVNCVRDGVVPDRVIQYLLEEKKKWVEDRGKRGIFRQEGVFDFYREIVKLAAEGGKLLLFWMELEGRILAVSLNFIGGKVVYGHTLAFDRTVPRYMPGIYLKWEAIVWAAENGYEESNFMEGAEEYKTRFTNVGRLTHVYLYPRTLWGRVLSFAYRVVLKYRRIKESG